MTQATRIILVTQSLLVLAGAAIIFFGAPIVPSVAVALLLATAYAARILLFPWDRNPDGKYPKGHTPHNKGK